MKWLPDDRHGLLTPTIIVAIEWTVIAVVFFIGFLMQ